MAVTTLRAVEGKRMESVEETPLAASLRKGMAASEQGKTKRERKKRVGCTRGRNVCEREHDLR